MKLVELKCKNCGAILKANPEDKEVTCEFCQTTFKIDDGAKHIKFDDMENNGYEFEKGRLRAQNEHEEIKAAHIQQKKKNSKMVWIVLAWIFFLPFTATYFIAKSTKLDKNKKILYIVLMWIGFVVFTIYCNISANEDKKNRIIECYSQETYNVLDNLIGMDNITGEFSSTYSCDRIVVKDKYNKKIVVEMEGSKLIGIKLDNKYIYNIDENVEIYDPVNLRVKEKTSTSKVEQ